MLKKLMRLDVCIGFFVAGIIITALGLYAASGSIPGATWEIMGKEIPPIEWGWPFAIFGIVLLLIGIIVTYFRFKKK